MKRTKTEYEQFKQGSTNMNEAYEIAYNKGFNATCWDRNIAAKNPYLEGPLANEWSRGYLDGVFDYDRCEDMADD